MRFILSVFIILTLSNSAYACANGRFTTYDFGRAIGSGIQSQQTNLEFFIGKVKNIEWYEIQLHGFDASVKFDVLVDYNREHLGDGKYAPLKKEIAALAHPNHGCGNWLSIGQIGFFAIKNKNDIYQLQDISIF